MRVIKVESVRRAVADIARVDGMKVVFDYLDRVQPHVPDFSMQAMKESDSSYGMKTLLLLYFVIRAFEIEYEKSLPICDPPNLSRFWQANLQLFEVGGRMTSEQLIEIMELEQANQRNLHTALSHLFANTFRNVATDPQEQKAGVRSSFVIKTVIDTLESMTND